VADDEPQSQPVPVTARVAKHRQHYREARRVLQVWLDSALVERIHEARHAEGRTLRGFVQRALEGAVEISERYAPTAARARSRKGRG
jgi:hypothetical protein